MKEYIEEKEIIIDHTSYSWFYDRSESVPNIKLQSREIVTSGLTDENYFDRLKEACERAETSVKVATLFFDDEEMAELLIETARRLKGGVYVLTTDMENKLLDEYNYNRSDLNHHLAVVKRLAGSKVSVRLVPNLHAKFSIFDAKQAIVGSANLTKNSLHNVPEIGVFVGDTQVPELDLYFRRLWFEFSIKKVAEDRIQKIPGYPEISTQNLGRTDLQYHINQSRYDKLWEDESWYDAFHELVENAKQSIILVTYTIDLENTRLNELLIDQLENGREIDLLLANYPYRTNRKIRYSLLDIDRKYKNFRIHIHPNNHAKFLLVDNEKLLISTKNYKKENAFSGSFEIGIIRNDLIPDFQLIWDKLSRETDTPVKVTSANEYFQKIMDQFDLQPFYDDLEIWIWTPAKAIFNWIEGPSLRDIIEKIENASYLTYYQMENQQKILSIRPNYRLVLSKDMRLVHLDLDGKQIHEDQIRVKSLFCGDKIKFQRLKSYD